MGTASVATDSAGGNGDTNEEGAGRMVRGGEQRPVAETETRTGESRGLAGARVVRELVARDERSEHALLARRHERDDVRLRVVGGAQALVVRAGLRGRVRVSRMRFLGNGRREDAPRSPSGRPGTLGCFGTAAS